MQFDMALLDMRMPKMDGNELAIQIARLEPSLPLIAISSAPLGPRQISREFSHYLTKPIKHRQLFNVCVSVMKKRPDELVMATASPVTQRCLKPLSPKLIPKQQLLDPELRLTTMYSIPGPCKGRDRSFLIAEDLFTNQRVAIGFLEKLGFHDFTVAEDGLTTLDKVRQRHYDVVLMDLKMPKMDGFETTQRIRKFYQTTREHLRQPYIIALTANAMGGVREKCAEAGMDAYVTKPIDMSELAQILNEAV
jgi:CheY-like chemotaxis protein